MLTTILASLLIQSLSAEAILEKADAYRSPKGPFELRVETEDASGDKSEFDVWIDGNEKSLMVTRAPARDVGRNLLMIDQDMWIFIPRLNRPVRIALQQRLVGQIANGDLSRMKWVGDYEPAFETAKDPKVLPILLKAKKKNLTYDKIRIFVDSQTFQPLSADYLTPGEKILKSATFEDYGPLGGTQRPRRIVFIDAIRKSEKSVVRLLDMKSRTFPAGFFSQSNLARPKL